jgi:hypothetical protein
MPQPVLHALIRVCHTPCHDHTVRAHLPDHRRSGGLPRRGERLTGALAKDHLHFPAEELAQLPPLHEAPMYPDMMIRGQVMVPLAAEGEAIANMLSHRRDRAPGGRRRATLAGNAQRPCPIYERSFRIRDGHVVHAIYLRVSCASLTSLLPTS